MELTLTITILTDSVRNGMMYEETSRGGAHILYHNMDKVGKRWNDGKRGRPGGVSTLHHDMDKIGREIERRRRVRPGVWGGAYTLHHDVKKIGKRQNNGEGVSLKRV